MGSDSREVPAEGLEPTRSCDHWILSPARLPVPPRRRREAGGKLRSLNRSCKLHRKIDMFRPRRATTHAASLLQLLFHQLEQLQASRRPEYFAENDRIPQTRGRSKKHGEACLASRWRGCWLRYERVGFSCGFDLRREIGGKLHAFATSKNGYWRSDTELEPSDGSEEHPESYTSCRIDLTSVILLE